MHTLAEIAPAGVPLAPAEMIACVVEAVYDDYAKANFPNYDQRREDLNTLANFARDYESAADFLDQLALLTSLDSETVATEDTEAVTLSSIHQAKGLEWKVVFVIWLSDGMFPSARSLESDTAIEEERRLFYVAITRAKDELYLTYPHLRLADAGYGEMCCSVRHVFSRKSPKRCSKSGRSVRPIRRNANHRTPRHHRTRNCDGLAASRRSGWPSSFLGLGLVSIPMSVESRTASRPKAREISGVLADTIVKAADKLRHKQTAPPLAPPPVGWPVSKQLGLAASVCGFIGVVFGCISWLVREHRRWTWAALSVSIAALAWTHVVVVVAIAISAVVAIVILGLLT